MPPVAYSAVPIGSLVEVAFVIGAAVAALVGLLVLGIRSRSPAIHFIAEHLAMSLAVLGPAIVVTFAMPAIYLLDLARNRAIIAGGSVVTLCLGWAWLQSGWLARYLLKLMRSTNERLWTQIVFAGQVLAILAAIPFFLGVLLVLRALGVDTNLP